MRQVGTPLKTAVLAEDGREQITGYHMLGDIIGLDGMATDRHSSRAVALEDSEVCVLPFDRIEPLAQRVPALQQNLRRFLAREISRDQSVMLLLGSMRAEERHRGSRGVKVTISTAARHTPEDVAADLREIADRLEGKASAAA